MHETLNNSNNMQMGDTQTSRQTHEQSAKGTATHNIYKADSDFSDKQLTSIVRFLRHQPSTLTDANFLQCTTNPYSLRILSSALFTHLHFIPLASLKMRRSHTIQHRHRRHHITSTPYFLLHHLLTFTPSPRRVDFPTNPSTTQPQTTPRHFSCI